MKLKLYNETAYDYETKRGIELNNSQPESYDFWQSNLRIKRWLATEIYEFNFPPEGLQGIQKEIVIHKLNELIQFQNNNPKISRELINLREFITRNNIIFEN